MEYEIRIILEIAPYKTITMGVSGAKSFREAKDDILEELKNMPEIADKNSKEIREALE